MSDIIHLLSDDLANKIAAGEVVVRPAAVVKELVENAIDAGATEVKLLIKDGGKSLIQVIDNGCGMSETDARMAFERHATSKIKDVDDLFSIRTMGFRGEALASIAAVAKVELKTRLHEASVGTLLQIEGAKLIAHEACQAQPGSSLSVKSLFYNVPARRKFLKSDSVETKHVIQEFIRIALANPSVKFSLFNNDKETYHLPAQSLHKRITQLFGKKQEERIVEVSEQTEIVSVEGFIGKPEFAKKTKGEQYFFVNNRFIKSGYLNHAVMRAYTDFIDAKEYPLYVLKLTIDPTKIDINVHPSKHEVKFEDEQNVYTIVSAAVRHALSKFAVTPTLDFDTDPAFNRHEFFGQKSNEKTIVDNTTSKKGQSTFLKRDPMGTSHTQKDWEQLYQLSPSEQNDLEQIAKQNKAIQVTTATQLENQGLVVTEQRFSQVLKRYILVEDGKGFLLIDQRRAHQRVLYESFLEAMKTNRFPSQKLLFPETVELNAVQFSAYTEHQQAIEQLGFSMEHFGQTTLIIHATPADLQLSNVQEFLETLLAELSHPTDESQSYQEMIAKHLALYGAIRHGQTMTEPEMKGLFQQLMHSSQPNYGIRKDKTLIRYTIDQLAKAFSL